MLNKLQHFTPASATATGSTSAVATITGTAGSITYVTDIAGSTDKAGGLLLVKQGTTVIWQMQLATSAAGINAFQEQFESPLPGAVGADVSVTVDGTTLCKANIAGFTQV